MSLATILLSAPRLLAGGEADHPWAVDKFSVGVGGLHLLALLDVVAGGEVTTILHPLGEHQAIVTHPRTKIKTFSVFTNEKLKIIL